MSKLIQMRQRIKAIETIKKITHAMRLISMSSHLHLKKKQATLNEYATTLETLFSEILPLAPEWTDPILHPSPQIDSVLYIIIGSQKGLCGNFNSSLFAHINKYGDELKKAKTIVIGKKAIDFVHEHAPHSIMWEQEEFSSRLLIPIAHKITNIITNSEQSYTKVIMWSNTGTSFFSQKPHGTPLVPLIYHHATASETRLSPEPYTWTFPKEEILTMLTKKYLETRIELLLFESLLAEQAARFVSMDGSTRNAQNLLDVTKLQYNKARQAKITKELTELLGSF